MAGIMERKRRLPPLLFAARVPREAAGMGVRWIEALLMRLFLRLHPTQAENLLAVREAIVETSKVLGEESPWWGEAVVALTAWDVDALRETLAEDGGPFFARDVPPTPSAFKAMRVRVHLPLARFPDAADRLARFLRDAHAPVVLSRSAGVAHFAIPGKSLKKHLLMEGSCTSTPAATVFDLTIGSHAFLGEWLESFAGQAGARHAVIEVVAID